MPSRSDEGGLMTAAAVDYQEDCDVQVAIGEDNQSIQVRRNGDSDGIFLKPADGLDGDGELYLTVPKLMYALSVLGWNQADFAEFSR